MKVPPQIPKTKKVEICEAVDGRERPAVVIGTLRLVNGEVEATGFKPTDAALIAGFAAFGLPADDADVTSFTMKGDPENWLRWLPYSLRGSRLWAQVADRKARPAYEQTRLEFPD